MNRHVFPIITLTALLAGCGMQQARPVSTPPKKVVRPAHPAKPPKRPARPPKNAARPLPTAQSLPPPPPRPEPQVQRLPGLESVIGFDARALTDEFGTPRLDVREGDARKLQFGGEACVLDVYLYPPDKGGTPRATYVDARRASDGQDVDRAACVAALRKR
jgi:hypothetical protein